MALTKHYRRGDPKTATKWPFATCCTHRFRIICQKAARLLRQTPAGIGRSKTPGRSLDQASAETVFQSREATRHRRWRTPQPAGRLREAARVDDGDEDRQFVQPIHDHSVDSNRSF